MTTLHNLTEKAAKRRRQILQLNELINQLGPRERLTAAQKRSLFIAMRNLRRAAEDLDATLLKIRELQRGAA